MAAAAGVAVAAGSGRGHPITVIIITRAAAAGAGAAIATVGAAAAAATGALRLLLLLLPASQPVRSRERRARRMWNSKLRRRMIMQTGTVLAPPLATTDEAAVNTGAAGHRSHVTPVSHRGSSQGPVAAVARCSLSATVVAAAAPVTAVGPVTRSVELHPPLLRPHLPPPLLRQSVSSCLRQMQAPPLPPAKRRLVKHFQMPVLRRSPSMKSAVRAVAAPQLAARPHRLMRKSLSRQQHLRKLPPPPRPMLQA